MRSSDVSRFTLEIPKARMQVIEDLKGKGGLRSKKEVFESALALLEWAVKELNGGRIIASIDESTQHYREVVMPFFANIKAREIKEDLLPKGDVIWSCEVCNKKGGIDTNGSQDVISVLQRLKDDHSKTSPRCIITTTFRIFRLAPDNQLIEELELEKLIRKESGK